MIQELHLGCGIFDRLGQDRVSLCANELSVFESGDSNVIDFANQLLGELLGDGQSETILGICARCVSEASSLDRLYGSYLYESPVGSAVRTFKLDDVRTLGAEQAEMFNIDATSRSSGELVVPIPLHKSRLRSRGYNQSEILARVLSERLGLDTRNDVLV